MKINNTSFTPEQREACRIIGTPIGNLKDISARALEAINECDILFAEDTRSAGVLLTKLGINKPMKSYYKDNEQKSSDEMISCIKSEKKVALISEAGMPCISDPGYSLISKLIEENLPFEVISGPTAFVHAAVISGICDSGLFTFAGFFPKKDPSKILEQYKGSKDPIVFYESPLRIKKTLSILIDRAELPLVACRELTKYYEEVIRITNHEDIEQITEKGEFCIVVKLKQEENESLSSINIEIETLAATLLKENISTKSVVNILKNIGVKRSNAYDIVQKISKEEGG